MDTQFKLLLQYYNATKWRPELTIKRPALNSDRTRIRTKGIVEQVDFTIHLCIYDHAVHYGAIAVYQQVRRGVL